MTANIYYSSTAFTNIFEDNSRSSFKADIDPSFFSHLSVGNLYAAVKSITFDNSYNAVIGKLKVPHFVIVEKNTQPLNYEVKWLKENRYQSVWPMKSWEFPEAKIELELESGKDYLFYNFIGNTLPYETEEIRLIRSQRNRGQELFGVNRDSERGFTNLKILCSNFVIQAIYMHPSDFGDSSNLLQFINRVYQTIWFEGDFERKEEKLIYRTTAGRCMLRNTTSNGIMVHLHSSIAEILGFTQLQANKQNPPSRNTRSANLPILIRDVYRNLGASERRQNQNRRTTQNEGRGRRGNEKEVLLSSRMIENEEEEEEESEEEEEEESEEEVLPSSTQISYEESSKRERVFIKHLNPEEFGGINYISSKNIREMLLNTSNLDTPYNTLLPLLSSFFTNDLEWNYYYIGENTSNHYVLSEEVIDIVKIKPQMIGLFASYSTADIYNTTYNKIVAYINNADRKYGVSHVEIRNPTYYRTSIEKLCKSQLNLIDISTGSIPIFAAGTPTYIQVHLKIDRGMAHKQFNIFLDSSDIESKKYFPTNTNTDFRIQLPQRLEFNKKWHVCLKSIFLGNDLFNIYEDKCYIKCEIQANGQEEKVIYIKLTSGVYKSIESITKNINELF